MGRINLNTQGLTRSQRQIPVEEIIQILGQNPLAQGITSTSDAVSKALAERAKMKKQAQQTAAIGKYLGIPDEQLSQMSEGTDPALLPHLATSKAALDRANRPLPSNVPFMLDSDGNATPITLPTMAPGAKPIFPKVPGQGGDETIDVWQDPTSGQISRNPQDGWIKTSVKAGTGLNAMAGAYQKDVQRAQPTSSTRSSAEFATTIIPHIQEMRNLIQEADSKGYIGPMSGRVYGDFLAGRVGSTGNPDADVLLGRLRTADSLMKTGAMRVHFGARGGQQMYDKFSDLLNTGKQSSGMLNGSLDEIQSFMQGYQDAGVNPKLQPIQQQGSETPQQRKARLLQELQNAAQ